MRLNEKAPAMDCSPGEGNENQFTRSNMKGISVSKISAFSLSNSTTVATVLPSIVTTTTNNDVTVTVYDEDNTLHLITDLEAVSGGLDELTLDEARQVRDALTTAISRAERFDRNRYRYPAHPELTPGIDYSVSEVAAVLGLHRNTVALYVLDGTIHGTQSKDGGPWSIAGECALAYVNEAVCGHRVAAQAVAA